jgi:hypothetical protein
MIKIRASTDDGQKGSLAAELMLHIACKKCFYSGLKEIAHNPNTVVSVVLVSCKTSHCQKLLLEGHMYIFL